MQDLNGFVVKYKGLATGIHHFNYVLDSDVITSLGDDDIKGGNIELTVTLDKKDAMLTFYFDFQGFVSVPCDKCLDVFDMPVKGQETLYVKFGAEETSTDENIIYLSEQESEIDLFEYIRQYIITALPMQRIHPVNEKGESLCNKEMLKKIENISSKQEEQGTTPFWEALKNLKQDN